ncbi:MAG TPA: MoaD/ThiS family protein [Ornithinimicrobium sp.]|uniref:MoaD/ThiS family protein n=1 Tax=Ornithinimicrobium sp. TaxID=1977084 RepID=UPI002B49F1BA|nr:MoaD/ThiS family protein [Ornithinimicrobium sp.]HKJ11530.1 MoaD/ThiS family protein [Ornithinimicrobium sp.]
MPTLRYFAAAAEAAGTDHEEVDGVDVQAVLTSVRRAHGPRLAHVLEHSSLLLDGQYVRDPSTELSESSVLDVLPPFAGG